MYELKTTGTNEKLTFGLMRNTSLYRPKRTALTVKKHWFQQLTPLIKAEH